MQKQKFSLAEALNQVGYCLNKQRPKVRDINLLEGCLTEQPKAPSIEYVSAPRMKFDL